MKIFSIFFILIIFNSFFSINQTEYLNISDESGDIRKIKAEQLEELGLSISDLTNDSVRFYNTLKNSNIQWKSEALTEDYYLNMDLLELKIQDSEDKQEIDLLFTKEIKETINKVKDVKFIFYTIETEKPTKITANFNTKEYYINDKLEGEFEFDKNQADNDSYSVLSIELEADFFKKPIEKNENTVAFVYLEDNEDLIFDVIVGNDTFNPIIIVIILILSIIIIGIVVVIKVNNQKKRPI